MCAGEILAIGEIVVIVLSIFLLCLNDSNIVNSISICLFMIQLIVFLFFVFAVTQPRSREGRGHCSEAYLCEPSSKKGLLDCKYLDENGNQQSTQCPDNTSPITTTKSTTKKTTTTTITTRVGV